LIHTLIRIGDNIVIKELTYSLFVKFNQSGTFTSSVNVVRVIIFSWKPFYSDVAPTVLGLLQYNAGYSACHGPLAHDNKLQYRVHLDRVFTLDGSTKDDNLIRGVLKLNQTLQYKAGSTTNVSNGLYLLVMSDAVAGVGPYPKLSDWIVRVNFLDS
jgi:hypothetical protein